MNDWHCGPRKRLVANGRKDEAKTMIGNWEDEGARRNAMEENSRMSEGTREGNSRSVTSSPT
jgi:hypothetical protein